jgi:hypothetical protein
MIAAILGLAACVGASPQPAVPSDTHVPATTSPKPYDQTELALAYTYHRPDGNRLVSGGGTLPEAPFLDVKLTGIPAWVVGSTTANGSLWAVVSEDGQVEGFLIREGQARGVAISPEQIPVGMPPLLEIEGGKAKLVTPPTDSASRFTHPIVLPLSRRLVFLEGNGDLIFWNGTEKTRLALGTLPDARIVIDESDRLLLLTDATDRYDHGVLGDRLEAASITLIETVPEPRVALKIPLPHDSVVEGIAPIWADLTGDGVQEIIVTVSDATQGAQILVFSETAEIIAAGPAIGRGYRWRHQLAVGPFGPRGETEVVDVLTPHIGGVVEFYQLRGQNLDVAASIRGYSSHIIGSRNLDMAIAGDFDGDSRFELLVPNQRRTELAAIRHDEAGAQVAWTVPIGGRLSTNIAAISLEQGGLAIAVGREGGVLRVWLP